MYVLETRKKRFDGKPTEYKVVDKAIHVYLVLDFTNGFEANVVGVYANRELANNHVQNLCRKFGNLCSDYGVIKKTVRGL